MKIITHEDIVGCGIPPLNCMDWVTQVIAHKDSGVLKPKISLPFGGEGFYNTMPALLPDSQAAGVKLVNRYPGRQPSLDSQLLLYDLESGRLLALMDANYITTMRTGAVAAHSIRLFATENFHEIGMIGLGNTARAAFLMLMESYPERTFRVKLKTYKDQQVQFAKAFERYAARAEFIYCDTYDEVVTGSDVIISSVTYAEKPFCADECYKPGCLVVPIHTRGFQNCDLYFDKVYADDRGHVKHFQYFDRFLSFGEVAEVVCGQSPGRESSQERILVYNIGIALHDLFFAKQIYDGYFAGDGKPELALNSLREKFWVK